MSQDYIDKLDVLPSECSCEKCKVMCHAPCCGSVEDFEKLIDAGYANRLMFDDLPSICDGGDFLKAALKGYEAKQSPWHTSSREGCTFFKNGKCELHDLNLKPILGRLAHHENKLDYDKYAELSKSDWSTSRGASLIEKWKKLVNYSEE